MICELFMCTFIISYWLIALFGFLLICVFSKKLSNLLSYDFCCFMPPITDEYIFEGLQDFKNTTNILHNIVNDTKNGCSCNYSELLRTMVDGTLGK